MSNVVLKTLMEKGNDSVFIQNYWNNLESRQKAAIWIDNNFKNIINNTHNVHVRDEMIKLNKELNEYTERHKKIIIEFYYRDEVQDALKGDQKSFANFLNKVSNEIEYNSMMFRIRKVGGIDNLSEIYWRKLTYRMKYIKKAKGRKHVQKQY